MHVATLTTAHPDMRCIFAAQQAIAAWPLADLHARFGCLQHSHQFMKLAIILYHYFMKRVKSINNKLNLFMWPFTVKTQKNFLKVNFISYPM